MSQDRNFVNADTRGPLTPGGSTLEVLRSGGPRAARLDAMASLGSRQTAALTGEMRRLAMNSSEDPIIRAGAIRILAHWGEAVALEPELPVSVRMALQQAREVLRTQTLISAIERGVSTEPLPPLNLITAPEEGLPMIAAVPAPRVLADVLRAATLPPSAAKLQVVLLHCGQNELALVSDPARISRVLSAPTRLGQLAVHHRAEEDFWSVPFEILTAPAGGGIQIALIDRRGRMRYGGTGQRTPAGGITFTVQASAEPGAAPILLQGRMDQEGITITGGRSGSHGPPARIPVRVTRPV